MAADIFVAGINSDTRNILVALEGTAIDCTTVRYDALVAWQSRYLQYAYTSGYSFLHFDGRAWLISAGAIHYNACHCVG